LPQPLEHGSWEWRRWGLPYLNQPRDDMPLKAALNTGRVHQAAATGSFDVERGAAVVHTAQSFDDVADAGYERTGDLLVTEAPAGDVIFPVVAER
jgi:hypothetical protein